MRSWIHGRRTLALLFLLAGAWGTAACSFAETGYIAEVTRVHDGDSVWVRLPDGGGPLRLRLEGIDAPEICQPGGRQARDRLAEMTLGREVRVEVTGQDRYRRALARLWLGEDDVQSRLVAEGWAWSYRRRGQAGPYDRQEAKARRQGLGLFSDTQAEAPWHFRRRHGPCS
ncbi:MAG: thermonuclease family protein [Burkholderiales bacterium]|nr:MAG: thermonuclease family protein [Burkholderiales bacterium]